MAERSPEGFSADELPAPDWKWDRLPESRGTLRFGGVCGGVSVPTPSLLATEGGRKPPYARYAGGSAKLHDEVTGGAVAAAAAEGWCDMAAAATAWLLFGWPWWPWWWLLGVWWWAGWWPRWWPPPRWCGLCKWWPGGRCDGGGGVLHAAVSANDQILGLFEDAAQSDLTRSLVGSILMPMLLLLWTPGGLEGTWLLSSSIKNRSIKKNLLQDGKCGERHPEQKFTLSSIPLDWKTRLSFLTCFVRVMHNLFFTSPCSSPLTILLNKMQCA